MTLPDRIREIDHLLSAKEAAHYLGLPRQSIYDMVYEGKITRVKNGSRVRFLPETIADYIEDNTIEATRRT